MRTYPMSQPITIGPGDFDPPDDGWPYSEEQTESVYRLSRVIVRGGTVCIEWNRIEVSVDTRAVMDYPRGGRSYSKVLHLSQYLIAAAWCWKQAGKRLAKWRRQAKASGTYAKGSPRDQLDAHMPRVWGHLASMADANGWEVGA